MTQQVIFTGSAAGDGTGARGQVPWNAFNTNSTELYSKAAFFGIDSGAANAYVVALATLQPQPAVAPTLGAGLRVRFIPTHPSTASSTLNFAGTGAVAIVNPLGAALTGAEIQAQPIEFMYNGAAWQILTPSTVALVSELLSAAAINALLTQAGIGLAFYPQTAAELAASITPTGFAYPELDLRRYGFIGNGIANDYPAIQSAILIAQQYTTARITFPPNATVLCNTGLTWDVNKVAIDLSGSTLLFTALTTGQALVPTMSQANPNLSALSANVHPLQNGILVGPGVTVTAVAGMLLNTGGSSTLNGLVFRNLSFREFATDIAMTNNTYCHTFENCLFTLTSGVATTYSIVQNAGSNNGERINFRDCWWYNKQLLIQNLSASADIFVNGGSMDGMAVAVVTGSGGNVFLNAVHVESGVDTNYWFNAAGASSIFINGSEVLSDSAKSAFAPFYSDSTAVNGGIFLDNVFLNLGTIYSAAFGTVFGPTLIAGTGNCLARNLVTFSAGARPALASALNWLAYPGFESGSYVNEWTLSTGAAAVTTQAHTGTHSLGLAATVGTNATAATKPIPCKPGQYMQGCFWYLLPAIVVAGGNFLFNINYLDYAGTVITTVGGSITTNQATWLNAGIKFQTPAPAGTVSASFSLVFGVTTGGGTSAFVDDVLMTIC